MSEGDAVLLWRSGRGGGIAALCTVVAEPEALPRPDGPPQVIVELRIERALGRPIAPATLLENPDLRPLAFMDLFETTEHRVTPRQEEALAALLADHEHRRSTVDRGAVMDEDRTTIDVPVRLVALVEHLLAALGADEPAPVAAATPQRSNPSPASDSEPTGEPTDLQMMQAVTLANRHGDVTFTVDDAAATWRTGVGTARSRIERLLDSGLIVRAGTLRSEDRESVRPTRGRPPVLYRLAEQPLLSPMPAH